MTGTNVITERARVLLDDTDPGAYRFSTTDLLAYLNDGMRIITEDRPESLLSDGTTLNTYADVTTVGATLPLADKYRDGLADYVSARALMADGMDKRDLARGKLLMASFVVNAGISRRRAL